jgi:hypothetical protein
MRIMIKRETRDDGIALAQSFFMDFLFMKFEFLVFIQVRDGHGLGSVTEQIKHSQTDTQGSEDSLFTRDRVMVIITCGACCGNRPNSR